LCLYLSTLRYVSHVYTAIPGYKEADDGRTSVATATPPNISPPITQNSKPRMSEDEPEAAPPVTEEKEKVTDVEEGVSAPTTTSSNPAISKESGDVSHVSYPIVLLTNQGGGNPCRPKSITTSTHTNPNGSGGRLSNEEIRRPNHIWKG